MYRVARPIPVFAAISDIVTARRPRSATGVEWKKVQKEVKDEHWTKGFAGRFGAGLPPISDGSLLFIQHMISKMKPALEDGSLEREWSWNVFAVWREPRVVSSIRPHREAAVRSGAKLLLERLRNCPYGGEDPNAPFAEDHPSGIGQ